MYLWVDHCHLTDQIPTSDIIGAHQNTENQQAPLQERKGLQ